MKGHRLSWADHERRSRDYERRRAELRRAEAERLATERAEALLAWWQAGNAPLGVCVCDAGPVEHLYWCRGGQTPEAAAS